jgi:hypothetical protein
MATEAYWFDTATLTMQTDDTNANPIPIAGVQDITVIPSFSIEKLYTADSVKIDAQQQHEFEVQVDIGFSKWDPTLLEEWLGGDTNNSTSLTDTSDPQKYTLTPLTIESVAGSQRTVEVTGITFEEMPIFDGSRGEFIQWDLDGIGEDVTDVASP